MTYWRGFAARYPTAAQWIREGGLFFIVSNLITLFKFMILTFLPNAFTDLWAVEFGWPGIQATLLGQPFTWNIFGYAVVEGGAKVGGLGYFVAYIIAMVIGECVNFPIQRSLVFRSKGNIGYQALWYVIAFCIITVIVNSINCIWVGVAGAFVPAWLYNIGTVVLNGGVSMLIFFFVNKIIFPQGCAKSAGKAPAA